MLCKKNVLDFFDNIFFLVSLNDGRFEFMTSRLIVDSIMPVAHFGIQKERKGEGEQKNKGNLRKKKNFPIQRHQRRYIITNLIKKRNLNFELHDVAETLIFFQSARLRLR